MQAKYSALPILLCVCLSSTARAQGSPRLWLVDDVQKQVYQLFPNGELLTSFPTIAGATSSIALDPSNDTLWGASEGSDRIVNYDKTGQLISFFPTSAFDPNALQPEGVDVNPNDGTLWIVDDITTIVYNVQKDGTLISSFPTSTYDPGATSPQGIAYDSINDTLWLTDNTSDSIYNVTTTGQLISSFPTDAFDPAANNPQDICSPDNGVDILWVTARDTASFYEITTSGVLLSKRSTLPYGSNDPTGILLDLGKVQGPPVSFFCTAKTTLLCGPAPISAAGTPSATAQSGFKISSGPTRGCRWGFLLYSNSPIQPGIPFGGAGNGVLCLSTPVPEAGVIDSGGTSPATCDGLLTIDLNAFAQSQHTPNGCHPSTLVTTPAAFLTTPGVTVNSQMIARDSIVTGKLLSNGLTFEIGP